MVMIIASHYAAHGIEMLAVEGEAWLRWPAGSLVNRAFVTFMNPGGEVGVALLFMITGYFQIQKKTFSLKKVVLSCLYYSVFSLLVLGAVCAFGGSIPYMAGQNVATFILRALFMPLTSTLWWYVAVYVFLMLFSPVLNAFLGKLNRKGFLLFLLIAWAIWYGLAGIIGTEFFALQKAVFFYALGAYVRLFTEKKSGRRPLYVLFAFLAWTGSAYCFYQQGVLSTGPGAGIRIQLLLRGYNALSSMIFVTVCVWCVFRLFEGLAMPYRPFVNRIAATTFGIYLIHDSIIMEHLLWFGWLKVAERQYPSPLLPLYAVLTVAGIFIVCSCLDLIRMKFFEPKALKAADRCIEAFKKKFCKN